MSDDLHDRAASLRISPQRLAELLACGSDTPAGDYSHKPSKRRKINHHIRKHPRMRSYYIVIRTVNGDVRLNGTTSIMETRRIRDAYLKAHCHG
jgi:hypothetical protein